MPPTLDPGRRIKTLVTGAIVAIVAAGTPSASLAAETVKLDVRDPRNETSSVVAPAQSAPLEVGQRYVVTVTGTASIWPGTYYAQNTCGAADAQPMEPSPGQVRTLAGWDAQTIWAAPFGVEVYGLGLACNGLELPAHLPDKSPGFQIADGAGAWSKPDPVGGPRSIPRSDHQYTYEFVGSGQPLRFRFRDTPATDNSGVFTIVVRTADACAAERCLAAAVPATDQAVVPQSETDAASVPVSGARACTKARVLSIRLVQPKGLAFAKTTYFLNSRRARTVRGARIFVSQNRSTVRVQKFRRLPAGRLRLRVEVVTERGQRITVRRVVDRCGASRKARKIRVPKQG